MQLVSKGNVSYKYALRWGCSVLGGHLVVGGNGSHKYTLRWGCLVLGELSCWKEQKPKIHSKMGLLGVQGAVGC